MAHSMTAFASLVKHNKWGDISCEIKSVNHRYLDCKFRLPENLHNLESIMHETVRRSLNRGRVECFLTYKPSDKANSDFKLNINLIQQLAQATQEVNKYFAGDIKVNPLQVLTWNNVMSPAEVNIQVLAKDVLNLFNKTLTELLKTRSEEGKKILDTIKQRLLLIKQETQKLKKIHPQVISQYRGKLLARLAEIKSELDMNRLEQEMVYFSQKIDITEELDLITIHVKEMQDTLNKKGPIGKKLDFLLQELNREANTLASKSVNQEIKHGAVTLKVIIEQMREQVQNIE